MLQRVSESLRETLRDSETSAPGHRIFADDSDTQRLLTGPRLRPRTVRRLPQPYVISHMQQSIRQATCSDECERTRTFLQVLHSHL